MRLLIEIKLEGKPENKAAAVKLIMGAINGVLWDLYSSKIPGARFIESYEIDERVISADQGAGGGSESRGVEID